MLKKSRLSFDKIEKCKSIGKVLRTLSESIYQIHPKQSHYESLEVDESWNFVWNKNNKQWLIYAYYQKIGEIIAYV